VLGTGVVVVSAEGSQPNANKPRLKTTNRRDNFFIAVISTKGIGFLQDLPAPLIRIDSRIRQIFPPVVNFWEGNRGPAP
jgi:hypothetical protein